MATAKPRGGPGTGQKWVDLNHEAKETAKKTNGGVLPYSQALVTGDFPNKQVWSAENLPEVLFFLQLPPNPLHDIKPEIFNREDGRELRKFDILPDYISVEVEGWLIHAWRATDDRIMLSDILDRMDEEPNYAGTGLRLKKPPKNAVSNDCYRTCRKLLGSYTDYARRQQPHRTSVEAVEKLSYEKIWMNTVLERCVEYPDRLVKVKFSRKGGDGAYAAVPLEITADNLHQTTYPMDYFCLGKFDPCQISELESDIEPAMSMLWDLQKKAELHGLTHWNNLSKNCLPESWFDRTKEGAPKKDTFDGGCAICTWRPGQDSASPKPQPLNFAYFRQRHATKGTAIDRQKAFMEDDTMTSATILKHGGILKRPRDSDTTQAETPPPAPIKTSDHGQADQPAKRTKVFASKGSRGGTRVLDDDEDVPEIAHAEPLETGTRYKIKYLEQKEDYTGWWETDTEVDLDSDDETLVGVTTNATKLSTPSLSSGFSKATNPHARFQSETFVPSPPKTPLDPNVRNGIDYAISSIEVPEDYVVDVAEVHTPLQAPGFLPTDFLDNSYVRKGRPGRDRSQSLALMVNNPPEDPFSSSVAYSFDHLASQYEGKSFDLDDFEGRHPHLKLNGLQEQNLFSLQQHSAALHSVMGFGPALQNESRPSTLDFVTPAMGFHPNDLNFGAPITADFQSTGYEGQLGTNSAPTTPRENSRADYFSSLMLTDDFNRIKDLQNEFELGISQESPLKNFSKTQTASLNVVTHQMSPTASVENQRPGMLLVEDDEAATV